MNVSKFQHAVGQNSFHLVWKPKYAWDVFKLKFKTSLGYKSVKIYSENDIHKFFKLIKPSNTKHNLKYKIFKKREFILLNKDLIMRR